MMNSSAALAQPQPRSVFASKTMIFALKMMNFALKMMNFALKMVDLVLKFGRDAWPQP